MKFDKLTLIDEEVIFSVIKEDMKPLKDVVEKIIENVE